MIGIKAKFARKLALIWAVGLISTGCFNISKPNAFKTEAEKKLDALSLTLEANLEYREFQMICNQITRKKLVSKVVVVPIKKEIIDSMIAYIAVRDNLEEKEREDLREKSYQEFLRSDQATFVISVVNNPKFDFGKDKIYFGNIADSVKLQVSDRTYQISDFTRNLDSNLNPGWNEGYLHFQNFRGSYTGLINAYSIHFGQFNMSCGGTVTDGNVEREIIYTEELALSFDESDINFVALVEDGLSKDDIRRDYNVTAFDTLRLTEDDILNLVKFTSRVLFKL